MKFIQFCLKTLIFQRGLKFCNGLCRCFDNNMLDVPVEIESPDHHYYHVGYIISISYWVLIFCSLLNQKWAQTQELPHSLSLTKSEFCIILWSAIVFFLCLPFASKPKFQALICFHLTIMQVAFFTSREVKANEELTWVHVYFLVEAILCQVCIYYVLNLFILSHSFTCYRWLVAPW